MVAVVLTDDAPTYPEKKITVLTKKAQRRTGGEVLKDIQSAKDDIVNFIVFQKESNSNPVSSVENPKEIAMYERFFANLQKESWKDKCKAEKAFKVDLVEVSDPLSAELL